MYCTFLTRSTYGSDVGWDKMSSTSDLNFNNGFLKEQLCYIHLAYTEEGRMGINESYFPA